MWSILKIYMGLGLSIIYAHCWNREFRTTLKGGEWIDGIFRPVNYTPFIENESIEIFKGMNMIDKTYVAMKMYANDVHRDREYEMCSYLKAINSSTVEEHGILPIYYYNPETQSPTVFPLFECNIFEKRQKTKFKELDYLILFRDFVRQSKYIHSCGIVHGWVNPMSIVLRKGRSFLTDFSFSEKFNEYTQFRRDWREFLFTMAVIVHGEDPRLDGLPDTPDNEENMEHIMDLAFHEITIQLMEKVKPKHLKAVMVEFYNEAYKTDGLPLRYDHIEAFIMNEINAANKGKEQPIIFSWLKKSQIKEALNYLGEKPPKTAIQISNPKAAFEANDYKKPVYNYFVGKREEMANAAKANAHNLLEEEDIEFMEKDGKMKNIEWPILNRVKKILVRGPRKRYMNFNQLKKID